MCPLNPCLNAISTFSKSHNQVQQKSAQDHVAHPPIIKMETKDTGWALPLVCAQATPTTTCLQIAMLTPNHVLGQIPSIGKLIHANTGAPNTKLALFNVVTSKPRI